MQNAQVERKDRERNRKKDHEPAHRDRERERGGKVLLNGNFVGILFDERTRRAPRAKPME